MKAQLGRPEGNSMDNLSLTTMKVSTDQELNWEGDGEKVIRERADCLLRE